MTITNEEVLLHLQKWQTEQTPLWIAYSSPSFGIHCAFSGHVDDLEGDKVYFAHKAGRPDALLCFSLSKSESSEYFQWDHIPELNSLASHKEGWTKDRPTLGIMFSNQTAVIVSDLSDEL